LEELSYEQIGVDDSGIAKIRIASVSVFVRTNQSTLSMKVNSMAIGKYECSAKNEHGSASGTVELRVLNATRVVAFPRDQTIVAGQTIYLPCDVLHDPQLKPRVCYEK
jgi:hypothetical protein